MNNPSTIHKKLLFLISLVLNICILIIALTFKKVCPGHDQSNFLFCVLLSELFCNYLLYKSSHSFFDLFTELYTSTDGERLRIQNTRILFSFNKSHMFFSPAVQITRVGKLNERECTENQEREIYLVRYPCEGGGRK